MDEKLFGEGVCKVGNELWVLTWYEKTILIYDLESFELKGSFEQPGKLKEGWGLTSNSTHVFMTTSSDQLYVVDPSTKEIVQ